MPVLIVSEKTSPHDGFSRNFVMRPSPFVMTTPYSSGSGTCFRQSVTAAPFSRWKAMTLVRSMSVSASPEMTRNGSAPSASPICRTDPPVPSGVSSMLYRRRMPTDPPSRSEEHTSELQSRENLVCRLLLEKKKKKIICPLHLKKKKKNINN